MFQVFSTHTLRGHSVSETSRPEVRRGEVTLVKCCVWQPIPADSKTLHFGSFAIGAYVTESNYIVSETNHQHIKLNRHCVRH
jgi:hypothetical protein